jgi:5-methyltetrahydropteroyltriglutamate--homocysteine methyltransferase
MTEHLIPVTVIGSWSFPGWFEKFDADVKAHQKLFGAADRDEAVRDAVRLAVDDQLRAGLDRITDGEMQRVDFNLGFYEYLRGLESIPPSRRWGAPAHDQRDKILATQPLVAPRGQGDPQLIPTSATANKRSRLCGLLSGAASRRRRSPSYR